MVTNNSLPYRLSAMLLALIVSACASRFAPPPTKPDTWPALPPEARVSLVPTPSECLPTCLSALTAERKSSVDTLTSFGRPAVPASESLTD